jgi:uncharacterized membrane protein (DUF4010 family)
MFTDVFIKLILSIALGALIGIERERRGKGELVEGMRTFILISFLATLSAYFSELFNTIVIIVIAFLFAGILTIFGYISKTRRKHVGLTTEIAFLLTFLIGLVVYFDSYPYILSVSSALFLTFILVSKGRLHHFAHHLKEKEIWNAIIFAIITFVILPILPTSYMIFGFSFNPFLVWLSIVLVLTISFVGYIAMKAFGVRKGIALTGVLGGFASSTAVAIAMSEETKKYPKIFNSAAFAVTLASSTMFLRMLAIDFVVNADVALKLVIPFALLGAVGYILSFFVWKNTKREQKINLSSPLALKSAFSFGIFFIVVFFLSHLVENYVGDAGIIFLAFLAGLVEVDAINVTLATLALTSISPMIAIYGIILASLSNTISKWFFTSYFGTHELSRDVGKVFLFLLSLGVFFLFFVSI